MTKSSYKSANLSEAVSAALNTIKKWAIEHNDTELLEKLEKPSPVALDALEKLVVWAATQTKQDFLQMINPREGKLKRTEVVKGSGLGNTRQLTQNPYIRIYLTEILEADLRKRGILAEYTEEAKENRSKPQKYDRKASEKAADSKRVKELELEVLQLKARLRRFKELSEVMVERGIDL